VGVSELKARADRLQRSRPVLGVAVAVAKKYGDDRAGQWAALITYYGFFSMFPLLMVAFTVLGFLLQGDPELRADIAATMAEHFPLPGIEAGELQGSGVALAVGLLLAMWSGLGATQVAQDAVNGAWHVARAEQPKFLVKRLRGVLTLGVVAGGIVASTAVGGLVSLLGPVARLGGWLGALAVSTLLVAGVTRTLLVEARSWRELWPGALLTALGWTALQAVGSWYVQGLIDRADKTYGTFAVVIGLLSWIYLQSQVFMLGVELSVVRRERLWPRALDKEDPTDADRRAIELITQREASR